MTDRHAHPPGGDDLALARQFFKAGRRDEAEAAARRFLDAHPDDADALNIVANCAALAGRNDEALPLLEKVVRLKPSYARARNNLAHLLLLRGNLAEAEAHARLACTSAPNLAQAHATLGKVLAAIGRGDEALASLRSAAELGADDVDAHFQLGQLYAARHQFDLAERSYSDALRFDSGHAPSVVALAFAQSHQGRLDESITSYGRVVEMLPGDPGLHSALIFTMEYAPNVSDETLANEKRCWWDRHGAPAGARAKPLEALRTAPDPLRIGYASPSLREHSVTFFLEPILEHHDRERCPVVIYSDEKQADATTERLRALASAWHDTSSLSHEQFAAKVREDRIDVLVDLTQHMPDNRLPAFAMRPAPVQVAYLGYPAATGVRTIDFRLSDPFLDADHGDDPTDHEQVTRLPRSYFCYRPPERAPDVRADPPCRANGHVTFVSHHTLLKLNERCAVTWARVLRALPDARLILRNSGWAAGSTRDRYAKLFASHGVDSARLDFRPFGSLFDAMGDLNEADIALDAIPFSGATTACHTMWMGVPMVTIAGGRAVHRMAHSVLSQVGLQALSARDDDEFVSLTVGLARDVDRLTELRGTMRERMRVSPLMDAKRFVSELENLYRSMWETRRAALAR